MWACSVGPRRGCNLSFHTLASLHDLASNTKTDFRRQLYDALLLYSRSSVTSDIAVKLVFVLVAIESILLKDFNEPIAKNIGEWMAFLVGDALEAKKAVVTNVDRIYKLRSAFIHHGDTIEDVEMVREFLGHAWETFRRLLHRMDRTNTKMSFDSGIRRAQAGLVCYSRTQRRLRMKTSGPGQMLPSDVLVPGPSGLASTQNFTTRSARGRPDVLQTDGDRDGVGHDVFYRDDHGYCCATGCTGRHLCIHLVQSDVPWFGRPVDKALQFKRTSGVDSSTRRVNPPSPLAPARSPRPQSRSSRTAQRYRTLGMT